MDVSKITFIFFCRKHSDQIAPVSEILHTMSTAAMGGMFSLDVRFLALVLLSRLLMFHLPLVKFLMMFFL
jgi:hypothetical protein